MFDISNTSATTVTSQAPPGYPGLRSVTLDVTELKDNYLDRRVWLSISLRDTASTNYGPIAIDLSVQGNAVPLVNMNLESYAPYLGIWHWVVTSGTLSNTRLTATEIEGTFSGTATPTTNASLYDSITLNNGYFAGRF